MLESAGEQGLAAAYKQGLSVGEQLAQGELTMPDDDYDYDHDDYDYDHDDYGFYDDDYGFYDDSYDDDSWLEDEDLIP